MSTDTLSSPQLAFAWSRRLGSAMDSLYEAAPRAVVVGSAGSGKSTALRHLHDLLVQQDRAVSVVAALGADLADVEVPPEHVLLVDDLHLLESDLLASVRRRAEDPDAGLIVTRRPWPASEGARTVTRQLEQRAPAVLLGYSSRSDVLDAAAANGEEIADACVDAILTATSGVSWMVWAALSAHDVRDCAADDSHAVLRRIVEDQVLHRLDSLEPDFRHQLEQTCLTAAAPAHPDWVLRGYAEGLLERNGEPVPVVRSAVRSSLPSHRLIDADADPGMLAAQRARAAWSSGDIDAATLAVDSAARLSDSDPGKVSPETAGELVSIAAAAWSARGMMAQADALHSMSPPIDRTGSTRAAIAAFGVGDARPASALGDPASATTTLGVALELLMQALTSSASADVDDTVLTTAVRAAEMYTSSAAADAVCELPAVIAAIMAMSLGGLATAQTVLDDALAGGHGGAWAATRLNLWRAWVQVQRARPVEAREALAEALNSDTALSPRDALLAHATRVALARRYEDSAELESAWREARASILRVEIDLFLLHPLTELICSAAKVDDTDRMRPYFERGLEIVERLGEPPLWSTHLRWAGIQQGILLSSPDRLAPHAKALVAASSHSPVAAVMAKAGRVWTSVLAGSVDPDAVEHAAEDLASIGLMWDAARLAGHGAGRSTDRRVSARLLACARELHPAAGARRQTAADDSLAAAAPQDEAAELLSEREIEVARLVLQGRTYAQIGEAIFISPRTAEHHIAHIRRRLGVSSRAEMLATLRRILPEAGGIA